MTNPTYPVTPSLSGTSINLDWMMNNPVILYRALRTLVQQRLVGGKMLKGRVDLTGSGTAIYGVSESIFPRGVSQVVAPGAPYPLTQSDDGTPAQATTTKTGLGEAFPQELVAHRRDDIAIKKLLKLANRIVFDFDAVCLALIASGVSQTQPAQAAWNTSGADQFLDTLLAGAQVDSLNQGYNVDTIVASPVPWARLVASARILGAIPRETADNAILTGQLEGFAGLQLLKTTNMPAGTSVMVLDSTQLGSVGYERLGGPGWTGDPLDVESKVMPAQGSADGWEVYVRKLAVPMIQEPGAAVKVTGV